MRSFEPATKEDVIALTGEPLARTSRLFKVKEDDHVLGIVGTYREHNYLVLYSYIVPEVKENIKKYKRAAVFAYKETLKRLVDQHLPVYAYADEEAERSESFLKHMGFTQHNGRVYQWRGLGTR